MADLKELGEKSSQTSDSGHIEDLTVSALPEGTLDPVYTAKAHLLNNAIHSLGMGKYQWQLFGVVGFGW